MRKILIMLLAVASTVSSGELQRLPYRDFKPFRLSTYPLVDVIRATDPTHFDCIEFTKKSESSYYDRRIRALREISTYSYNLHFDDAKSILLEVDTSHGMEDEAQSLGVELANTLGRIPNYLRIGITRMVLHTGDQSPHVQPQNISESQIIVYSGTMRKMIDANNLDEVLFHEAVHATWDSHGIGQSEYYQRAFRLDGGRSLTQYAERLKTEDLAEHSLFAYAYHTHAERLDQSLKVLIEDIMPHRLEFIGSLIDYSKNQLATPLPRADRCGGRSTR